MQQSACHLQQLNQNTLTMINEKQSKVRVCRVLLRKGLARKRLYGKMTQAFCESVRFRRRKEKGGFSMKRATSVKLLASALSLSFLLAACGGNNNADSTEKETEAATTAAEEQTEAEKDRKSTRLNSSHNA